MDQDDKDIIRIGVNIGGTKTSISLDGRMFFYLTKKIGDDMSARGWVRETIVRLEREWANAAENVRPGERVRANTGLSRAIQREVLDELMRDIHFSHNPSPTPNGPEQVGLS